MDHIRNASLYYGLGSRIAAALQFLEKTDLAALKPGKYPIDDRECYAIVSHYETKPLAQGAWEAHRRYADIQYIISGAERMGYANLDTMSPCSAYDDARDFVALEGEGDFLVTRAGTFFIFGTQDAHMPGIAVSAPEPVRKVVVKVPVE